ncbi:MAG: helix-turn-helix domain-containing protein, partial [Acidimicrobiales bacterium]
MLRPSSVWRRRTAARRRQRRTTAEIAERAGITRVTLRRIEHRDPNVALGLYFEVASVLGMPLFGAEGREQMSRLSRVGSINGAANCASATA